MAASRIRQSSITQSAVGKSRTVRKLDSVRFFRKKIDMVSPNNCWPGNITHFEHYTLHTSADPKMIDFDLFEFDSLRQWQLFAVVDCAEKGTNFVSITAVHNLTRIKFGQISIVFLFQSLSLSLCLTYFYFSVHLWFLYFYLIIISL